MSLNCKLIILKHCRTVELKPKELVQTLKGRHGNKSILCSKVFPFQYKRSLRTLITSGTDKTIRISSFDDLDEREDVDATIIQMDSAILDIDLCDGMLLAAAMNKTHHIIDVNAGVIIQSFSDHSRYVVNCLFGGKGAWFATGSHDTTVCLYKRVEGRYILAQTLQFLGAVESMCCIQGSTLVVGTRNDNHLHYFPITIKEDGLDVQHSAYNMNANGDAHCSFTPMHIVPCPRDENLLIFTDSESGRLVLKKAFRYYRFPNLISVMRPLHKLPFTVQ
jgi:WD40 repeat protein